jgi:CRP/FNR family cyclic AMP-dependent transcriptional regulator
MEALRPRFVVGIGGSAGSLDAFKALLDALPSNSGLAFIFVFHISLTATSRLADILSKRTKMPVMVASTSMPIRANHVYVMPPSAALLIEDYAFELSSSGAVRNRQIDTLFISLAKAMEARAVGVVLSGYDGDGTEGCRHIKDGGGTTFAQDKSAAVAEMSLSAQASGSIDFVLPPDKIAVKLIQLARTLAKKTSPTFDAKAFLSTVSQGRTVSDYRPDDVVFIQESPADAVFYIQKGQIKLTVMSKQGKEAVVVVIGKGEFFGEGCLIGQPLRLATARALSQSVILRVAKDEMVRVLHSEPTFSELFIAHLLTRSRRVEEDLVDHIFSSAEKRLARKLLLLASVGKEGGPQPIMLRISQETLAEIIGTTRSRVSFFMNKFRKLGFISYNGHIEVHSSLLSILLDD